MKRVARVSNQRRMPRTRYFYTTTSFSSPSPSSSSSSSPIKRPTTAPKPYLPLRHIRENPSLYAFNCLNRDYPSQAASPALIASHFSEWKALHDMSRDLRHQLNLVTKSIASTSSAPERASLIAQAKDIKDRLHSMGHQEPRLQAKMENLAMLLPNLTSEETPVGKDPAVLSYINEPTTRLHGRSHAQIGAELGIIDIAAAANTSGHGWYFLVGAGAALEQALVQYALAVATRHGWTQVSPPSMVYMHIAGACGFQPRDQADEAQIYTIAESNLHSHPSTPDQDHDNDHDNDVTRPKLCLAGTAEIPLAGMLANTTLQPTQLPLKRVATSRCYRAEAGSHGANTRGLYRVHEFTKVEMFAWTAPDKGATTQVFDEMLDIQTEILGSMGLHCRVLEMPSADLGASSSRKCDIEAFFPSRRDVVEGGWGELASTSICTDYQTRRLATRMPIGDKMGFPWTANGTALAVPRVLAAILENSWDEHSHSVCIPEVLRPWMGGMERITSAASPDKS